jgi:hypothetical protein
MFLPLPWKNSVDAHGLGQTDQCHMRNVESDDNLSDHILKCDHKITLDICEQ